jgi:hypothetical protein
LERGWNSTHGRSREKSNQPTEPFAVANGSRLSTYPKAFTN